MLAIVDGAVLLSAHAKMLMRHRFSFPICYLSLLESGSLNGKW
jgi:hypothetical protein